MTSPAPTVTRARPWWIAALAAFLVLVAGANAALVWLSGRGHRDLVRPDYYEAGLAQDSLIARTAGQRAWTASVAWRREGADWILEAPAAPAGFAGGNVRLYRPDDGRSDRQTRLEPMPDGAPGWRARFAGLKPGRWIATFAWESGSGAVREGTLVLDAGG